MGINPEDEANVARYHQRMEEDQYLQRAEDRSTRYLGEQVIRNLGYSHRGAENTLDALIKYKKGEAGVANFGSSLTEAMLPDLALWPRIVELDDRVFSWQAQGGVGGLIEAQIAVANMLYRDCGKGKGLDLVEERQVSKAEQGNLGKQIEETRGKLKNGEISSDSLAKLELRVLAEGLNSAVIDSELEAYLTASVLIAEELEDLDDKSDDEKRGALKLRIKEKREQLKKVQQGVSGLGLCVQFLDVLVPASTDIGEISNVFTSSHVKKLPTHAMRLVSLSPDLKYGTTVAMRALLGLDYWKDKQPTGPLAEMGHKMSLSAMKGGDVTVEIRDKFLSDLEEAVVKRLEDKSVENALQIGESSTALAIMFHEILTLGGTGSVRDRKTGKVVDVLIPEKDKYGKEVKDDNGNPVMVKPLPGSGSLYPGFGASDAEEKLHRARDRKTGEARKGRPAPRPMIAKAISQELLFGILQYNEAIVKDGDSQRGLGMSILEALTDEDSKYDIGHMLEQLGENDHFIYMLFVFRAVQIVDALEKLPIGRIDVVNELGGGPEKIVQEMVDVMLRLHKAYQTIPFVSDSKETWIDDEEGKNAQIGRNMVNLWSEFVRASRAKTAARGGYVDNPEWVGFRDRLRPRTYERMAVHTNAMTAQQYQLAWLLGTSDEGTEFGGIITEKMLHGNDEVSVGLRKILGQNPEEDPESVVNITLKVGYEGYEKNEGKRKTLLVALIEQSAKDAQSESVIPHSVKREAEFKTDVIDGKKFK